MCVLTGERTGILASAEDDLIDGEEDEDDLDASVETDEGIVADDTDAPATATGEAVSESDAEKVPTFGLFFSVPHFRRYIEAVFLFIATKRLIIAEVAVHQLAQGRFCSSSMLLVGMSRHNSCYVLEKLAIFSSLSGLPFLESFRHP